MTTQTSTNVSVYRAGQEYSYTPSATDLVIVDSALPPTARRLVVLVPDQDIDEAELARRVWSMASPRGLGVLFLSLRHGDVEEPHLRLRLATLAAMTRDRRVHVDTHLRHERDWVQAVQNLWQTGDLVVCDAAQSLNEWNGRRSLGLTLTSELKVPVCLLAGFHLQTPARRVNPLARLVYGIAPLIIIAGFFLIQVQLDRVSSGWAHTILMSISVLVELGLIWVWSQLNKT